MTQLKVTKDQAEVYLGKMEVGIAQKKKRKKRRKKKISSEEPGIQKSHFKMLQYSVGL